MATSDIKKDESQPSKKEGRVSAPELNLPKGGGAIHGMGEKFAANPVTGTGSTSIPISVTPGRAGFGPQLALSYDSGAGNNVFGLGWNLSQTSISRKTDKGLPRYFDKEDSDVFIFSGAEDLVPYADATGKNLPPEKIQLNAKLYSVYRYRPRIEGGFALIERWLNDVDTTDCFWRTISRDNRTSWFGRSDLSRISDPENKTKVFQWLLDETHDDKGNVIQYVYIAEDSAKVIPSSQEYNRTNIQRSTNRYLKRILYGNTISYLDKANWTTNKWMFEVVFDFGDHKDKYPTPLPDKFWDARGDAFSHYRAGFEIRTYRLCQRVLMFHHFSELDIEPHLVKSTDFSYRLATDLSIPENAGYSQISSVKHLSYEKDDQYPPKYQSRYVSPLDFTYSPPIIDKKLHNIDSGQLDNLPVGTQGSGYQWVDLDGEGLSGVLSDQGGAWHYKPNYGEGKFGPSKVVSTKPSLAFLGSGSQQLMDLSGNGQIDLVDFSGQNPGFQERTADDSWKQYVPFVSLPNIDWHDANLRFLDLTGDGHADALITENEVFTWYPSLDVRGFDRAEFVSKPLDEEVGLKLVFADGTQTIFLADMCGDGLTDIVRIRNGETCYWPNIGYGHFGRKIKLDNSPVFDHSDLYDPSRIRLSDIDGSGPIDIIYLGREGAKIYFNRSGNSLSNPYVVNLPVATENLGTVQVADLLGTGTACLVWNSHLPADTSQPVRYINLMSKGKPHLLVKTDNNLGVTTEIKYTPSTFFYIQDKLAGTPWVTRLPFPVHCVSRVTIKDKWRGTTFSNRYSYHHGYFDGAEREFRGFGRVEQVDVEDYGTSAMSNIESPYITQNKTLYQPPIKTITWYHTGAAIKRQQILSQFEKEYFPARYQTNFKEKALTEPGLPNDLSGEEWREALRACKGMVLRQESYELDIDELQSNHPKDVPVRFYSAATHNCNIQLTQPRGANKHAVFLVTESEAISYYYELDLSSQTLAPDPRISHTLNLRHDEYGNPQQSVAITYGRISPTQHAELPTSNSINLAQINEVQAQTHIAYAETRYTEDVILPDRILEPTKAIKHYRLRVPYEVRTYEITGLAKLANFYFELEYLRKCALSEDAFYPPSNPVVPFTHLQYHQQPQTNTPHRRIVEHACTRFFDDGDSNNGNPKAPAIPLAIGKLGPRGLKYEDYKLALTTEFLDAVFKSKDSAGNVTDDKVAWQVVQGKTVHTLLNEPSSQDPNYLKSGYILGAAIDASFSGQYWMRSGTAGFASDANFHFYLPEEYTDPFDNKTKLAYDGKYDLFIQSSTDAMGNSASITSFDYRTLSPRGMIDPNGNETEAAFDIMGQVIAVAIKGKKVNNKWQGDDLAGFNFNQRNPSAQAAQQFCTNTLMNEVTARSFLGRATTRFVYHFGDENGRWATCPAGACSIVREQHVGQLASNSASPLQVSLECSDGGGNVLMKKVQAEPKLGQTELQWIINGLTILNNKGKPVKQYEPDFSNKGFGCEMPPETGVTPVIYYDAAGRTVRTEMPDGTFSRVEFSPWHVKTFDPNDTAFDPSSSNPKHSDWYLRRMVSSHPKYPNFNTTQNIRAANLVKVHASTPAISILDSLGRDVIAIAHNRIEHANGTYSIGNKKYREEYYTTYTKLDAEGKPLWIRDALGHLVMQYILPPRANNAAGEQMPANAVPCYDIAGNLLFQHSMDAGDKWTINDAAGKPMFAWDVYKPDEKSALTEKRLFSTKYDALHRPIELRLKIGNNPSIAIEKFIYQDAIINPSNNLNGQLTHHYDASGLMQIIALDFKGSPLEVRRQLLADPMASTTDWQANLAAKLSSEYFLQLTEYDALKRMTRLYNWHNGIGSKVAVYEPSYSERGTLKSETLIVQAERNNAATGKRYNIKPATQTNNAIQDIGYDAKGQRQYLKLGNGTITRYEYDIETYRLKQLRTTRPAHSPEFPKYQADLKDAKVLQQLSYTYDPVGNITEIYVEAYKPAYFQNAIIEPQNLYEYDALYRLISATGREDGVAIGAPKQIESAPHEHTFPVTAANAQRKYTQTYQYDAVGNFLAMAHVAGLNNAGSWTRQYQYAFNDPQQPASNRLWRTWQGDSDWNNSNAINKITYQYDSHGSMLNLADVPDEYKMQWDYRDMIASIDLGGGGIVHYQYDAGKQRTRKTITKNNGNIVEERIYLGGLELYRRKENGVLKEQIETLHLFDGEQRLLMVDQVTKTNNAKLKVGNLYRYTLSNHLGSSTVELDDKAEIVSYEEYHPYGTSAYQGGRNSAGVKLKRYRYTGMERDEESGLSYHTARYYLPWLGRWGGSDPKGIRSLNLNLFAFVKDNPIKFIDLDGMQERKVSYEEVFFSGYIIGAGEFIYEGGKDLAYFGVDIATGLLVQSFGDPLTKEEWASGSGYQSKALTRLVAGRSLEPVVKTVTNMPERMSKSMERSAEAANSGDYFTAGREFSKPAIELITIADVVVSTGNALNNLSSASRMDAAIARMTASEARFSYVVNSELKELLIGMEIDGIAIPGEIIEAEAGIVMQYGGAFHKIDKGITYINYDEIVAQLHNTGLKSPRQVLLHELGHYGQSTKIKTNADGAPTQVAYYEREAAASEKGAQLATDLADAEALRKHAAESRKVVELFKQP